MTPGELEQFYGRSDEEILADSGHASAHANLLAALESGQLRAARPCDDEWQPVAWVKRAILAGFRSTDLEEMLGYGSTAIDKTAYPPRELKLDDRVRLVPGGSAVRRGAYVAAGVVIMPPAYVNVGAYVDEGTMIDSHALVGSCAQIGRHVHLSAGAQVGGVLEPAGARPVVVEDDAFIGALVGLFEGIVVRRRAVLASGVTITGSTVIHDLVRECVWQHQVPAGAVVVPGSRPASGPYAAERGLQVAAPMIVKYRDEKTDGVTALEQALR